VLFKRAIGDVSFCQVAIFFTMIGICSTFLLWPLILTFYFSGLGKDAALHKHSEAGS
jgi:solute carrier family 35 protein F3/4